MSDPEKLYKFRDWDDKDHKRILTHNEIFFASPSLFNDPFDCKVMIRYDKLTRSQQIERLEETLDKKRPEMPKHQRWNFIKEIVDDKKRKSPEWIREFHEDQNKIIAENFGICTLTSDPYNIVMWSHYSNLHRGFCVGFNVSKLESFFLKKAESTNCLVVLYSVDYATHYPVLIPVGEHEEKAYLSTLKTKSKIWKYEKEYRLIMHFFTNCPINLDQGIITDVILGCQIPKETKKEIINILSSKNEETALYQAKMKELSFGLNFERIEY